MTAESVGNEVDRVTILVDSSARMYFPRSQGPSEAPCSHAKAKPSPRLCSTIVAYREST